MLLDNHTLDNSHANQTRRSERIWPTMPPDQRLHRWIIKTMTNNDSMWSGDHSTQMRLSQKLATALGLQTPEVVLSVNGQLTLSSEERTEPLAELPRNQEMIHPYKRRDYRSATQSDQE